MSSSKLSVLLIFLKTADFKSLLPDPMQSFSSKFLITVARPTTEFPISSFESLLPDQKQKFPAQILNHCCQTHDRVVRPNFQKLLPTHPPPLPYLSHKLIIKIVYRPTKHSIPLAKLTNLSLSEKWGIL